MDTVGGEKLRDFLRIKQDTSTNINTGGGRNNLAAGLTLTAVLSDRRLQSAGPEVSSPPRIQPFRTLLDIIQEDQTFNNAHMKDNKKSWKGLKGLRFRRGDSDPGSSWTSSMRMPTSEIPINRGNNTNAVNGTSSRMLTRPASAGLLYLDQSTQPDIAAVPDVDRDLMSYTRSRPSPSSQRNANRAAGRTNEDTNSLSMPGAREDEGDEASPTEAEAEAEAEQVQGEGEGEEEEIGNEEGGGEQQPARMSLMALLAETDREMGLGGSAYSTEEEEDDTGAAAASTTTTTTTTTEYNSCCVCMVRHKGAAFIPCGHTFCRQCCRELLVQRGSCPLCNNYIVEILDIF